jgi:hypothetical protein
VTPERELKTQRWQGVGDRGRNYETQRERQRERERESGMGKV